MRKFILTFCSFIGYTLIISLFSVLLLLYFNYHRINLKDLPAPNLSNSYSYNEKMEFLRKNKINSDIIAIGSSMSLNNLNSIIITKRLKSDSYINTASWGMSMKDNFLLLKTLSDLHNPKTLIVCSNILDFQQKEKNVKYPILKHYLTPNNAYFISTIIQTFNLKYYLKNLTYAKKVRSCKNDYEFLKFDKFGGVNFDNKGFQINKNRWNQHFTNNKTIGFQYLYLDSLSTFCKNKNIKLYFFQSPIRNGLYSKLNKKEIYNLQSHIIKIELILKNHGHSFVNSNYIKWNDNLFVDGIHLNAKGSVIFTKYCFDNINKSISSPSLF